MQTFESNSYGKMELIKLEGDQATVRFINTGYTRKAHIQNVRAGKVKDHSVKYEPDEVEVDIIMDSNSHGKFRAFSKKGRVYKIMFLETGTVREVLIDNAKAGKVIDPYAKTTYGIGCRGDLSIKPKYFKQANQLWRNMMKRCYSQKDTRGYYGKAFVSERWLTLSNFVQDLPEIEGFDKWLEGYSGGVKYNLDKDTILKGNNIYSKELCRFLPESINKSITTKSDKGLKALEDYLP